MTEHVTTAEVLLYVHFNQSKQLSKFRVPRYNKNSGPNSEGMIQQHMIFTMQEQFYYSTSNLGEGQWGPEVSLEKFCRSYEQICSF